jgi:hypothetical protein
VLSVTRGGHTETDPRVRDSAGRPPQAPWKKQTSLDQARPGSSLAAFGRGSRAWDRDTHCRGPRAGGGAGEDSDSVLVGPGDLKTE